MKKAKHTPGPWEYLEGDYDDSPRVVHFLNGNKIHICKFDFSHIRTAIALLKSRNEEESDDTLNSHEYSRDVERANAQLTAAAPDLLEALEHIIEFDSDGLGDTSLYYAKLAINKAKGEEL